MDNEAEEASEGSQGEGEGSCCRSASGLPATPRLLLLILRRTTLRLGVRCNVRRTVDSDKVDEVNDGEDDGGVKQSCLGLLATVQVY